MNTRAIVFPSLLATSVTLAQVLSVASAKRLATTAGNHFQADSSGRGEYSVDKAGEARGQ